MAESVFNDSLFEEFERDPQPSDKLLRQKCNADNPHFDDGSNYADGADSEDSQDSDIESENETGRQKSNVEPNGALRVSDDENALRREINALQDEKKHLEKASRLLKEKIRDEEGPSIQVVFMNHRVSRKYRSEIESFISGLIESERKDGSQLPILQKRPNAVNIVLDNPNPKLPDEKMRQTRAATVIGSVQMYREFLLDHMGWPLVENNPQLTDGWDLPIYTQVFQNPLPCDSDSEDEDPGLKPPARPKAKCWNCGNEDHSVAACPKARDQRRINQSRMDHQKEAQNAGPPQKRYTMDSLSSKFEKYKPGVISDGLRKALGISSNQLAPFTYRMRHLGYPPGWIREAEVETSGITLFDKHGKEVAEDGDSEDGELNSSVKKMLDPAKLVTFPGFNAPREQGILDESRRLNMPPLNPRQQLEVMRAQLSQKYEFVTSGKRRRADRQESGAGCSPAKRARNDNTDSDVMELSGPESPVTISSLSDDDVIIIPSDRENSDTQQPETANTSIPPPPPTPERPPLPLGTPPVTPQTEGAAPPPLPPTPDKPPLPVGTPPLTPQTPANESGLFKTPHGIAPLSSRRAQNKMADTNDDGKDKADWVVIDELTDTSQVDMSLSFGYDPNTPSVAQEKAENSSTTVEKSNSDSFTTPVKANVSNSTQDSSDINSTQNKSDTNPSTPVNATTRGVGDKNDTFNETASSLSIPANSSRALSRSSSLSQSFGTPVQELAGEGGTTPRSATSKWLPSADKFAQGISEHLPFENLPNSTGSYARVRKLLDSAKKSWKEEEDEGEA